MADETLPEKIKRIAEAADAVGRPSPKEVEEARTARREQGVREAPVPHSELADNLRREAAEHIEPLSTRLELLAAWADDQVAWFAGFWKGNEMLIEKIKVLEGEIEHLRGEGLESDAYRETMRRAAQFADMIDAVNELIKPQWRSMDYDRNKLLDDLREAVGMQVVENPEEGE